MRHISLLFFATLAFLLLSACSDGELTLVEQEAPSAIVVTSLLEPATASGGTAVLSGDVVTFREAVEAIADGGIISFDPALDGETIELSIVGEEHSVLKGEVMGFDYENNISYLVGYFERDYGKSALYAHKSLTIDASMLTNGITLEWTGAEPARVLAVYGNLTMNNVTITGGSSVAEEIEGYDEDAEPGEENSQPWTLGRGGAVAVWGVARLSNCTLHGNSCLGDFGQSRDRGAFGGGIYADIVHLDNCIVSGNSVVGAGAAGGGVYSVGGADNDATLSTIEQSSITGNRISGLFTYGGGVYSDGGGIGHLKTLSITNSTIARNLVEPPLAHLPPFMLPSLLDIGYWRAGGVYMSNGYMQIHSSTIVENEIYGKPRTDAGAKPNLAGGIAATIGDAHTVETMVIDQSIITGNTVYELDATGSSVDSYQNDIFTGSLLHFYSYGHNLIGALNFDHILVPVPQWDSLSRKHWPETGDSSGVDVAAVLDLGAAETDANILSMGVDSGNPVVLWYPPAGVAVDAVPDPGYSVTHTLAEVDRFSYNNPDPLADFLPAVLDYLANTYPSWAGDLETKLGNPTGILWNGPATTWPSEEDNQDWIEFWHDLDTEIAGNLGAEKLGDDFWSDFYYENTEQGLELTYNDRVRTVEKASVDQLGNQRTGEGDVGAIEQ